MTRNSFIPSRLAGTPSGIRTRDLDLERVASWATRRWGRAGLFFAATEGLALRETSPPVSGRGRYQQKKFSATSPGGSVSVSVPDPRAKREPQDLDIELQAPVLDVVKVVLDPL